MSNHSIVFNENQFPHVNLKHYYISKETPSKHKLRTYFWTINWRFYINKVIVNVKSIDPPCLRY